MRFPKKSSTIEHIYDTSRLSEDHKACLPTDYKLPVFPIDFMLLTDNQLDAQFSMYVHFYSLHVSGGHLPSGMQEHMLLQTGRSSTQSDINQVSH